MFSGVPLILAQLRYPSVLLGSGAMVASGGLVFLLGSLMHSPMPALQVLVYVGCCGLPALVTAEFLKRRARVLPMVAFSSFQIIFFLGALGFTLYKSTHGTLWAEVAKSIHQAISIVIETAVRNSQTTLSPADLTRLASLEPLVYRTFLGLLPGILGAFSLMTSIALWATSVAMMEKSGEAEGLRGIDRWALPDPAIFGLIASLALLLVPVFNVRLASSNIVMIFGVLYAGQGLGVLVSYIRKKKFGSWFWLLAGVFMVLQPMFFLILSLVGVLDIWFDFRQIRGNAGTGGGTDESEHRAKNEGVAGKDRGDHGPSGPGSLRIPERNAHCLGNAWT